MPHKTCVTRLQPPLCQIQKCSLLSTQFEGNSLETALGDVKMVAGIEGIQIRTSNNQSLRGNECYSWLCTGGYKNYHFGSANFYRFQWNSRGDRNWVKSSAAGSFVLSASKRQMLSVVKYSLSLGRVEWKDHFGTFYALKRLERKLSDQKAEPYFHSCRKALDSAVIYAVVTVVLWFGVGRNLFLLGSNCHNLESERCCRMFFKEGPYGARFWTSSIQAPGTKPWD